MSRVFGDSTPFPHDIDYLDLLDHGVECAVKLVAATDAIQAANRACEQLRDLEQAQLGELDALLSRVEAAAHTGLDSASEIGRDTAQQLVGMGRQIVGAASASMAAEVERQKSVARAEAQAAREATYHAVEEFVGCHTSPGSAVSFRLSVAQERCVAQVAIGTPFNLQAVFTVDLPDAHPWAKPRRVAELVTSMEVQLPQEAGWLSKRVEMTPVKLDRFFIGDAQLADKRGTFQLRKSVSSPAGFEVGIDLESEPSVVICPVDEQGNTDSAQRLVLGGEDAQAALALWNSVRESTRDIAGLRRSMSSARFDNQPLEAVALPTVVAEALIRDMAPLTNEISRRSGAPGELVLRRNLGDRRREETYLTHAELLKKILVLPPESRRVFAPLGLDAPELGTLSMAPITPRTSRAPNPSGPPRASSGPPPSPRQSRRAAVNRAAAASVGPTVTVSEESELESSEPDVDVTDGVSEGTPERSTDSSHPLGDGPHSGPPSASSAA